MAFDDDHSTIGDSPFRHLRSDLLVALGVLVLVFAADYAGLIPSDKIADRLLPFYVDATFRPDQTEEFLFIDIDAETSGRMGEPLITPRDALADLLKFATQGGESGTQRAKVVIVDIALSHGTEEVGSWNTELLGQQVKDESRLLNTCPERENLLAPPALETDLTADQTLAGFFGSYEGNTPIVLARGFSFGVHDPWNDGHERPELSFLDDLPTIVPIAWYSDATCDPAYRDGRIFWAAPLFERDPDLIVRRWRLWSTWCRDDQAGALPSVQLLTLALAQEGRKDLDMLKERFQQLGKLDCKRSPEQFGKPSELKVRDTKIDFESGRNGQRIIYTARMPKEPFGASSVADQVMVLPAHVILDRENIELDPVTSDPTWPKIDTSVLDGRIVVIGASHPQARDAHATPIGVMPGPMLIINAVNSLSQFGTLKTASWFMQVSYSVITVIVIVLLFYFLNFRLAVWLSGISLFVTTLLISILLLRNNLWLNTAIPATGLAWFSQLVAPLAAIRALRDQGWLAFCHQRFHKRNTTLTPTRMSKATKTTPTTRGKKRTSTRTRKASKS